MVEFIDAYMHCGLSKYKPLAEVERAMALAKVDRAILVQHLGEFNNTYIKNIVACNPNKFAGAYLVDYKSKNALKDLRYWAKTENFRGVRFLLESLGKNPVLWQEAVNLKLNIIVYDPDGIVNKLKLLINFLDRNPTVVFIISHLGSPNLDKDPELTEYKNIFHLSRYPRVYFQLSGMHMFLPYPYKQFFPIIIQAIESFGPDRVIWGGNYPVLGSDKDYQREVELIRSGQLPIPPEFISQITYTTAYNLWFNK